MNVQKVKVRSLHTQYTPLISSAEGGLKVIVEHDTGEKTMDGTGSNAGTGGL